MDSIIASTANLNINQKQPLDDWQVAPAEHEIANYDRVKIRYRKEVEDKINSFNPKALKKMVFYTISTNVMCADKTTSRKPPVDPIFRDIYLPLEICLVRASLSDHAKPQDEREQKTLHWIINPGPPTDSRCEAMDHKKSHKIDYDQFKPNEVYVESDLRKIVKEINAFLGPDRTVYSQKLKYCRQDLGCLKWLNRQVHQQYGNLMKPIKVYSLEDLFIAINRKLFPDSFICLGIVELKFIAAGASANDEKFNCRYHQDLIKQKNDDCTAYCAMAVAKMYSNTFIEELAMEMDNDADAAGH